jgi:hypothetical protein
MAGGMPSVMILSFGYHRGLGPHLARSAVPTEVHIGWRHRPSMQLTPQGAIEQGRPSLEPAARGATQQL